MITKVMALATEGFTPLVGMFYHKTQLNADNSPLRCRPNGKCKTWKRYRDNWRLPVKHGLRRCFYLSQSNAHLWTVFDPATRPALCAQLGMDLTTPDPVLWDAYCEARAAGKVRAL